MTLLHKPLDDRYLVYCKYINSDNKYDFYKITTIDKDGLSELKVGDTFAYDGSEERFPKKGELYLGWSFKCAFRSNGNHVTEHLIITADPSEDASRGNDLDIEYERMVRCEVDGVPDDL